MPCGLSQHTMYGEGQTYRMYAASLAGGVRALGCSAPCYYQQSSTDDDTFDHAYCNGSCCVHCQCTSGVHYNRVHMRLSRPSSPFSKLNLDSWSVDRLMLTHACVQACTQVILVTAEWVTQPGRLQ